MIEPVHDQHVSKYHVKSYFQMMTSQTNMLFSLDNTPRIVLYNSFYSDHSSAFPVTEESLKVPACILLTHSHTMTPLETSLLKTLLEKEKLLVTSKFSFSYGVFYLFG